MFNKILEIIKRYDTVIIHRHTKPDGDALGAQIGLALMLKESFPHKKVYTVGDSAGRFSFMKHSVMDVIDDSVYEGALAIILDTSASALISDNRYTLAAERIRIDHHIFCEKIAETELTDTSYESCCGIIADMGSELALTVSDDAAEALFTGMVTDSGRFRYDSVSSRSFTTAAFLRQRGFSTEAVYRNLYADELSFIQLRAKFILKIRMTDRPVAYIYTDRAEAESYGVDSFTISRGMVNVMGDVKGIDVWVNFTETESGVLAELRSSKHNVNPIAVKYGGGGHAKASGATLKNKDEAMKMLEDLCRLTDQ